MSDYMFMLESHLSPEQNRVLSDVQQAAAELGVNLFLAGGAMRDMLGGFQVRDLDFTVEGAALKLVKALVQRGAARIVAEDTNRNLAELVFSNGVPAQIAMARQERFSKPGARPLTTPATIQEDLRGRDFSINAIALSLNRASKGLLLDPSNGLADLERRELRALSGSTFYDDPARLLRLVRLKVRFGFTVEERTARQYQNAREAKLEDLIPARTLFEELRQIAAESNMAEILKALEQEKLLGVFLPNLGGAKLNLPSLTKLEKAVRLLPVGDGITVERLGPFLYALTEKFSPSEKAALIRNTEMRKSEIESWQKLEARAHKLETTLRSPRLKKPSQVYAALATAPGEEIVFLLYHSANRTVQDRIRNHLQRYLPLVQEVEQTELQTLTAKPGTPKYQKEREALLADRLDHRKKPAPPPPPPLPVPETMEQARPRR
jgi:tRNA nucleotidyltransferase (CCA-adding enzyme)